MATDKDFKVKNGLQVDTDTLVVDATNDRVGIGTTSPSTSLHISEGSPTIRVQDTDGTNQYTQIGHASAATYFGVRNDTADGNIIFGGYGGGSFTEFARFNSSGHLTTQNNINLTSGNLQIGGTDVITSARALTNITGITSTGAFKSSGGDSGTSGQLINAGGSAVNQTNSGTLRLTERTYDVSPYYQGAFVKYDGSANRLRIGTHAGTSQALSDDVSAIEIGRGSTTVDFQGAITTSGNITAGNDINISGNELTFTDDTQSVSIRAADALKIQSDYNTGENKPIYLQPSATTEVTVATGQTTFANDVIVSGNLTVNGTTTTIDTTNTNVKDNNITLNYSTGDSSATANNAGITIQDAVSATTDATILWDATYDRFNFSHEIKLPDNEKLLLGGGSDFQFYHNGTDSVIDNLTGDLYITNKADDKDIIFQSDDGSGGFTTYMQFDGSDTRILTTKDMRFSDSAKALFGFSNDLQIYHNGTDSFITNDTGIMYIRQNLDDGDILLQSDNGSGGVTTYIQLDGSAQLTNFAQNTKHNDSVKATFGASQDLQIYHDGSNSYIKDIGTGNLRVDATNFYVRNSAGTELKIGAIDDGAVDLYYDGSKKFRTTSTGIDIDGEITADTGSAAAIPLSIGGSTSTNYTLQRWITSAHSGSTAYMIAYGASHSTQAGNFAMKNILSGGEIYFELFNGFEPLRLTSTGATFTGNISSTGGATIGDSSADALVFTGVLKQGLSGGTTVIDSSRNLVNIGTISSGAINATGALSISGGATRINMQEDHYVNRRFDLDSVDNNGTIYVLLCEDAANNDVNGTIKMARTSGLRHACSVDILISSGNSTTPVGTIRSMGTAGAGTPTYSLVKGTHTDTKTYIALKIVNPDSYYETSGAYFTGRIKTTVSSNEFLGVTTLTSISNFDLNGKHQVANLTISGTATASGTIAYSPDNGGDLTLSSDSSYGTVGSGEYVTLGFGGKSNGYNRIFGANTADGNLFIASATGRAITFRTNGGSANTFAMSATGGFQVNDTNVIDASRNLLNIAKLAIGTATTTYGINVVGTSRGDASSGIVTFDPNYPTLVRGELNVNSVGSGYFMLKNGQNNAKVQLHSEGTSYINGGNLGVGTSTPYSGARVQICGDDTSPSLNTTAIDDCSLILSNSDDDYGTVFATDGTGKGYIQQRRMALATYYDLNIQPYGGSTIIGGALEVGSTISSGAATFNFTGDAIAIKSLADGTTPVGITFTSQGPSGTQIGHIRYTHRDTLSYDSLESFTIGGTETTATILADGKLMFKEGLYIKPTSGTGAGTQIIDSSANLSNIGTISNSGNITSTGASHTFYSGGADGSLAVGRDSNQAIRMYVTDNYNTIYAYQDSDADGTHSFDLRRDFGGTGANNFRIMKGSVTQLEIDTNANATFANGVTIEGTTTFNDDVSFTGDITSNINAGNNAISAGNITSTGNVVSLSANYIYHQVDQTDSGSITMGVSSTTAEGFLIASNTGTNHVATAPALKFMLNTDGGSLVEEVRIDAGGLDIKNGGLDINGTEVITSARNLTNIGLISSTRLNSNNGGYTISYSEGTGQYPNIRLQDTSGTNQYGEVMHINGDTKIRSYNGFFTNGSITFAGNSTYGSFNTSGDFTVNSGSIFLNNTGQGIHMLSPNGTEYQLTVDNSGNLVITEI